MIKYIRDKSHTRLRRLHMHIIPIIMPAGTLMLTLGYVIAPLFISETECF